MAWSQCECAGGVGRHVVCGRRFHDGGRHAANYIAQWNGSSWSALGSGMNSDVYALAVSGSTLYAGGDFTTAGGSAANYIAQWNGSSWSALGSGMMNPYVYALAVSGSTLYAGGYFTTAGGGAANYIAQWNGSSWSALGSGMNGMCMRWRCRAAHCMRAAISRRRAAARPITSRNGTGAVGRRSVRG
jgi:hypothetical protein